MACLPEPFPWQAHKPVTRLIMIKKIAVEQLRIGMFVCDTDRKWIDLPFFRTKFLLTTPKQIATLKEYCHFVYIDPTKGLDELPQSAAELQPAIEIEEDNAIKRVYRQCRQRYALLLDAISIGQPMDHQISEKIVADLLQVMTDHDLPLLQPWHESPNQDSLTDKSVHGCLQALTFGTHLALPEDKLHTLALGALYHDIGLLRMPDAIRYSHQPLSDEQRILMQQHPVLGYELLTQIPDFPEDVLNIVLTHHERMDGNGYPNRIPSARLSPLARMLAIVSGFESLIWPRPDRPAQTPASALSKLYDSKACVFDAQLVANFILATKVYPTGCLIELNNGLVGVIADSGCAPDFLPRITLLTDAQKQLVPNPEEIDLSQKNAAGIHIHQVLSSDDPVVDLIRLFAQV